jgi:diguanylate cyclase (GGDEF)-like protein
MAFWRNLAVHKDTVSDRLGRPISIEVALLDYLDSRVDDACPIRRIRRLCESVFARLSYYDRLSGMHDPQYFKKLLDIESRKLADHGASYSIATIDITFLRIINDQEGFEVGDKVIADVGAIIAESLRDIDICSRIGGDEFLIVLPYATLDEASAVSRSIYDGVASYSATEFRGKDHSVSITYGVASSSPGDTGLEAAIERASVDLYAKRNCAARREV